MIFKILGCVSLVLGFLFSIGTLDRISNNELKNDQIISSFIIIFVLFSITYFFLFYKSKGLQNNNTILSNKVRGNINKSFNEENIIGWGWRVLFLIIWISLIVPAINEAISPSSQGRVNEGIALFYGLIQSIVYVIGLVPLFLKYLSIKGININLNNIQITDNNNEKIHKKTINTQQTFNKTKAKKSMKVKKQSFDQQAKSIETFIKNYDFPQTDDAEIYTYEFDYIKKDKIIFLEIEVYIHYNKKNVYPVLHLKINLEDNSIEDLGLVRGNQSLNYYETIEDLLDYLEEELGRSS